MNKQEIGYMDIMYELTAMSVICPKLKGYGFVIYVYSNDHIPPHIHISEDLNTKDIAKVAITNETPRKKKDVVILDGSLTSSQKAALIQWANSPYVKGAKVIAKVEKQGKDKKIVIFKYKCKDGSSHRKQGHRQPYTKLTIEAIEA